MRERERGGEREIETERVREKIGKERNPEGERRKGASKREVERCRGKREARDGIPVARERERISSLLFLYIFF